MIYDIMYRDGGNYKKFFRGQFAEGVVKQEEDEVTMEESGMTVGEFFEFMGWSYDSDLDHNLLEVQLPSEDQDLEPDVYFDGRQQIRGQDKPYFKYQGVAYEGIEEEVWKAFTEQGGVNGQYRGFMAYLEANVPVMEHVAAVDVPPHSPNKAGEYGEWVNLEHFYSKKEAIAWAKEHLGADDLGRISVISTF